MMRVDVEQVRCAHKRQKAYRRWQRRIYTLVYSCAQLRKRCASVGMVVAPLDVDHALCVQVQLSWLLQSSASS